MCDQEKSSTTQPPPPPPPQAMTTTTTRGEGEGRGRGGVEESERNVSMKLIVRHMEKRTDTREFEKWLRSGPLAEIPFVKTKKPFGTVAGSIWFSDIQTKQKALFALNNKQSSSSQPTTTTTTTTPTVTTEGKEEEKKFEKWTFKGQTIEAVECSEANEQKRKRLLEEGRKQRRGGGGGGGGGEEEEEKEKERMRESGNVNDVVAPLWKKPMEEQLETKAWTVKNTLKAISKTLLETQQSNGSGAPWIEFEGKKVIPTVSGADGYRNKLEFTVGFTRHRKHIPSTSSSSIPSSSSTTTTTAATTTMMTEEKMKEEEKKEEGEGEGEGKEVMIEERCVGFSEGGVGHGMSSVVWGEDCLLVPSRVKEIRRVFEEYVKRSKLSVHDRQTHRGFWRGLDVRHFASTGDTSVVVQVNPSDGGDGTINPSDIDIAKSDITHFVFSSFSSFSSSSTTTTTTTSSSSPVDGCVDIAHPVVVVVNGERRIEGSDAVKAMMKEGVMMMKEGVTTVMWQEHTGVSNFATTKPVVLRGNGYIREQLLGHEFRVSPGSFFQTNSVGAGVLYSVVKKWCEDSISQSMNMNMNMTTSSGNEQSISSVSSGKRIKSAKLFDVCCGTGTIGQIVGAVFPGGVIGVDICEEAIADARVNASLSSSSQSTSTSTSTTTPKEFKYVAAKAEDVMRRLTEEAAEEGCMAVAVVDPPRGGLHPSVLKTLRGCRAISHVIYVSCNPKSLVNDAVVLCKPMTRSVPGAPFKPIKATGVDMFPHTDHLEMVMLFTRPSFSSSSSSSLASSSPTSTTTTTTTATTTTIVAPVPVPVPDVVVPDVPQIKPQQQQNEEEMKVEPVNKQEQITL